MSGRLLLLPEGEKIKALRLARGFSERECSRLAGISRETLRSMEDSNHATKKSVAAIAALFGTQINELATFKGRMAEISGAA
jgi:transcriptional regulator with XRE-family HTH domain